MSCSLSGWWFKPDFIINDLNINSAVARPWHDEVVSLKENSPYTVKGYAYAGELVVRCKFVSMPQSPAPVTHPGHEYHQRSRAMTACMLLAKQGWPCVTCEGQFPTLPSDIVWVELASTSSEKRTSQSTTWTA